MRAFLALAMPFWRCHHRRRRHLFSKKSARLHLLLVFARSIYLKITMPLLNLRLWSIQRSPRTIRSMSTLPPMTSHRYSPPQANQPLLSQTPVLRTDPRRSTTLIFPRKSPRASSLSKLLLQTTQLQLLHLWRICISRGIAAHLQAALARAPASRMGDATGTRMWK